MVMGPNQQTIQQVPASFSLEVKRIGSEGGHPLASAASYALLARYGTTSHHLKKYHADKHRATIYVLEMDHRATNTRL